MTKVGFKNGDLFQISLPNELGFAYIKCINLLELDSNAQYPILIRIYNYRSLDANVHPEKFINKELILCPLLIAGIIPAIKRGTWKSIGNIPIGKEDAIIPHYKRPEPNEENPKEWFYLIDADISKKVKSTYEYVKHLETIGSTGSELVGTKIAMALLRDEGKKIEDYFKLEEYYEKVYYDQVIKIPAYYKQPEFMRGRALE